MNKANRAVTGITALFGLMVILPVLVPVPMPVQASVTAQAQETRYDACMKQVQEQPMAAYEEALAWEGEGGGAPARHCVASSLIGMGDLLRAAQRLENLGHAPELQDPQLRAHIFQQAGETFLQINRASSALLAFDNALAIKPDDLTLQVDRARSLMVLERDEDALAGLDNVIAANPEHLLALQLRAAALIKADQLALAEEDVKRALLLAPTEIDVLLLRGRLREAMRLAGNSDNKP